MTQPESAYSTGDSDPSGDRSLDDLSSRIVALAVRRSTTSGWPGLWPSIRSWQPRCRRPAVLLGCVCHHPGRPLRRRAAGERPCDGRAARHRPPARVDGARAAHDRGQRPTRDPIRLPRPQLGRRQPMADAGPTRPRERGGCRGSAEGGRLEGESLGCTGTRANVRDRAGGAERQRHAATRATRRRAGSCPDPPGRRSPTAT